MIGTIFGTKSTTVKEQFYLCLITHNQNKMFKLSISDFNDRCKLKTTDTPTEQEQSRAAHHDMHLRLIAQAQESPGQEMN